MVTRVSPSFIRVGQFELFGRRAVTGDPKAVQELEQLVVRALVRLLFAACLRTYLLLLLATLYQLGVTLLWQRLSLSRVVPYARLREQVHTIHREFPDGLSDSAPVQPRVLASKSHLV